MDLSFLPALVADAFGTSSQTVDVEQVRQDHDYAVAIVTLAQPSAKIVVKVAGMAAPRWTGAPYWDRLPWLTRLVQQRGVLVPDILETDTSCRRWPVRYLIRGFMPGITWAAASHNFTASDRHALLGELGAAVASLHSIKFAAFGEPDVTGGVADGLTSYPAALVRRAAARLANPAHLQLFERVVAANWADLDGVRQAALTHDDLNPTNLLVSHDTTSWRLAGVVELDSAWSGNPESDLARLELWRGMMAPTFWQSYLRHTALANGYTARRAVLQLLWCLEYAHPTTDHHQVTAAVCATLGIPPLTFG